VDNNIYDLPPGERAVIPPVGGSRRVALDCLDKNRDFLKKGGVFTDDMIDAYLELKMAEVARFEMTPHPVEFDMYYSV
jgi:glutamine synthetase